MRTPIVLLSVLTLVFIGVYAQAADKQMKRVDIDAFVRWNSLHGASFVCPCFFEGFENGFPPSGWERIVTNSGATYQQAEGGIEGDRMAYIRWDTSTPQDEHLTFAATIDVAAGEYVLSFWAAGCVGEAWDRNASETVEVDGTVVWDFDSDVTGGYMEWGKYFVDLSAWDGRTVTVDFRYVGMAGDAHFYDAVMIDSGVGWDPDPPDAVDFCARVENVVDGTVYSGDTCDGLNLVEELGCEAYPEGGLEDYFSVRMPAGSSFTATVVGDADCALWVVRYCSVVGGDFGCLAYADETVDGGVEELSFANTTGEAMVVFLVVDFFGIGSCGTYEMTFDSSGGATETVRTSFGEIKSLFR